MTDEAIEAILRTVELGIWPDRAAQMHGVNPSTLRSFRESNAVFRTALEKAEAKAEASIHGRILRHMEKQWTACAWMLERRWPERWAKREAPENASHADAAQAFRDAAKAITEAGGA